MAALPSAQNLEMHCLFCDPDKHDQGHQVLLRSDNFYVFAGLGAIHEGYVIITPYTCDFIDGDYRSIASLPRAHLDELRFLREIVSQFYRNRYGVPGLSFEHGRAGSCLVTEGDTRHCYHPHLCCYPVDIPLWEHTIGIAAEEVDGVHGLAERVGSAPYLYLEHCEVFPDVPVHMAAREKWRSRVARLPDEVQLGSQFLRRALAAALGRVDLWDWQRHPSLDAVAQLIEDFSAWLADIEGLVFMPSVLGPTIDFVRSVATRNGMGYDAISANYATTWRRQIQHGAVARFVRRLPDRTGPSPLVLDLACGPGNYIKAFHHLGLRCVGGDISVRMLDQARVELQSELRDSDPPQLLRMDIADPPFRAGTFDGIWFSAGLVHLPRSVVVSTLARLHDLLAEDGVLYVSAQVGQGLTVRHEGRVFVYYTDGELRDLFRANGFNVVDRWDGMTERGTVGDTRRKTWVHYLVTPVRRPTAQPKSPEPGTLAAIGERGVLQRIKRRLPELGELLVLAAGDDAAAVSAPPGSVVVATIDPCPQPVISILEGPDPWVDGWYSMMINLSDLAAMGARPIGTLLAIEAPPSYQLADLDRFYDGALEAASCFDAPVIGGNVKDAVRFSCVGVALGHVPRDRMLRRDTARPGEAVLVLGTMGMFWAGVLQMLQAVRVDPGERERLRQALRQPVPRLREGVVLADLALARCAMDSSDGVTACLYEIAGCSGVDVHVDLSEVAADPLVDRIATAAGIDVRKLLLAWGDWQLVCTVPAATAAEVTAAMASLDCPVWEIGWTSAGTGTVWLHDTDRTAVLNYVASERFSPRSYFTHGIDQYAAILRDQPLVVEPNQ